MAARGSRNGGAGGGSGRPLTLRGTTGSEDSDAALVPQALEAVTVKVYAVPLSSAPTTIGLWTPVAPARPGVAVTANDDTGPGGAVKLTRARPFNAVAATPSGATGGGTAKVQAPWEPRPTQSSRPKTTQRPG